MYKIICILFSLIIILVCCNTKKSSDKNIVVKDTFQFAPIIELIKADAFDVEKTPYFLYCINTIVGSKIKDSTVLKREKFAEIIKPLISISITKEKFKEVSFEDLSTKSISFITTSTDTKSKIKSITTLLNDETKNLTSMYFVFEIDSINTKIKKQYFWKAGKSLTIITTSKLQFKTETTEKTFINWNDKVD